MDAQAVIRGLVQRGIAPHIAAGIAGNFAVESGFDPGINEIAPVVEGSRGGYGLAQWTGPRRVQYEAYARDRGSALDDLDTQLDFLLWELDNTERRAGEALQGAETAEDAARIFSEKFLRPGIPHLDRRISAARQFAGRAEAPAAPGKPGYAGTPPFNPVGAPSGPQDAPRNALAAQRPQMQTNYLDPRRFQMDVRPVNRLKFT